MAVKEDKVQVSVRIDGKQGINELGKLEMEAYEARQELKGLKKGTEEYAAANKKLADVQKQIKKTREDLGLTGMTLKQLTRYQRELNNELSNLTRGTKQYDEVKAKVQEVSRAIGDQRADVKGLSSSWDNLKGSAKSFGVMALGMLGLDFISGQLGKIVSGNAELSDSFADIRKSTGMAMEEVEGLNAELEKIDTRSTTAALRDIAVVGGQIGVAKEEILGFVEATDKAVVALGDEFAGGAEEVAKEIGSLQKLFKETKDLKAGEAISQIGSALNQLGAAGSATAPEVAEFTKRIGTLGDLAPQITQTLGLGAAFQELGLSAEISSGGLSNILLTASKDAETFAKFLGMPVEKFKEMINTNPNETLLVLADRFKGLSNTQVGEVLKSLGINSQEATRVMSLLATQTDMVREKQALAADAMRESTSLTEEFNVKNNNLAANLDKLGKIITSKIVNSGLVQFLGAVVGGMVSMVSAGKPVEDLTNGLNKQKLALIDLRVEFNAQMEVLKKGNLSQEQRSKLIADINKNYKDYLPQLITEKTTTEELTKAQKGANTAFFERIKLMAKQADMTAAYNQIIKYEKEIASIDEKSLKRLTEKEKILKNGYKSKPGGGPMPNAGLTLLQDENLTKTVPLAIDRAIARDKDYQKSLREKIALLEKGIDKTDEFYNKLAGKGGSDQPSAPTNPVDEAANRAAANAMAATGKKKAGKTPEELEKERQAEIKRQTDLRRHLEDMELSLMKDGFDKQRLQAQRNFEREAEDLMTNKQLTAEMEKALKLKLIQDLAEIDKQDAARKLAEQQTRFDNQQTLDTAAVENEFLKQEFQAKLENDALLELDAAQWKQQRLWEIEKAGLEQRMKLLVGNDEQTVFQRQQLQAKLDQIALASNTAALEHERKRAATELALQQQKYDAAASIVGSYGNAILGLMEQIGASSAAMVAFEKSVAFAQILIDTAKAISSVTAKNAATSITPIDFAVKVAASVATVMANIATAKKMLSGAATPQKPSFFFGGPTGSGSMGFGDRYGEFAGYVHKDEYVIDAVTRRDPQVANYESIIESKRSGLRSSSVAEAQAAGSSGGSGRMEALMAQMVAEQQANRAALNSFRGRLKADVSLFDLDEKTRERDQVYNDTRF